MPDSKRTQADGQSRGFNISDFRAVRNQLGILRNHDFHIEIPWPEAMRREEPYLGMWRNLELVCDSVNFPATALQTYQVHRYSYGPTEKKPTIPQFGNLEATILTDQFSILWKFFHRWLQLTVNYDFNQSAVSTQPMDIYEISYTHEYCVDIYLYIYDPYGNCIRKVAFRQAYPVAVSDVPLAWAAGNQIVRVPVSFAFFDWSEEFLPPRQAGQPATPTNIDTGPIK